MTARVTAADVKAIIETELLDTIVDVYILGANTLLNNTLGTGTSELMKEIERWLAAHMIASSRERQAAKEGAGGASIEYVGQFGSGFKSTSYGQMVLSLDTSGKFLSLDGKNASVYAVKSK